MWIHGLKGIYGVGSDKQFAKLSLGQNKHGRNKPVPTVKYAEKVKFDAQWYPSDTRGFWKVVFVQMHSKWKKRVFWEEA